MQNSRNIVTIILSVLAVGLIVEGLIYAQQRSTSKKSEQPLQTETSSTPAAIPDSNEIPQKLTQVVWKTYNNTKFGYSIKYFSDWKVDDRKPEKIIISSNKWRQGVPEGGSGVEISVEDKTLEQFIAEYDSSDLTSDGSALSKIIKQESYNINGVNGYKLIGTTAIGLDESFIFISRKNKSYIIRYFDHDNDHLKIMETLKFNE
jgi:hypothetical protein